MYDELIKDLREWPRVCVEYTGSLDELLDKAADAIEELQATLCNWCAVCPEDKRDIEDCEIAMIGNEYTSVKWATCQPEPPKEET